VLEFERVETAVPETAPERPIVDLDKMISAVLQANGTSHQQIVAILQTEVPKFVQQIAADSVKAALNAAHITVLGLLQTVTAILAVRFILLLSLVGAFCLAWTAMGNPSYPVIAIFVSYVLFTVLPLVWLDRNRRQSKDN
jgi:hypothetical protein